MRPRKRGPRRSVDYHAVPWGVPHRNGNGEGYSTGHAGENMGEGEGGGRQVSSCYVHSIRCTCTEFQMIYQVRTWLDTNPGCNKPGRHRTPSINTTVQQ